MDSEQADAPQFEPSGAVRVPAFVLPPSGLLSAEALAAQQAHPGLGIKNRFNVPDCPERVHWDEEFALEVGAPGAYDYGPERCSWLTHQVTNWIGDDGFLHKSKCQIRRHNPDGDVLFIDGTVTRKYEENGKKYVEIQQVANTHRGEQSAFGTSVAELPSKG